MAKFKPVRERKPAAKRPSAVGCILLLALLFGFLYAVMYYSVKPG